MLRPVLAIVFSAYFAYITMSSGSFHVSRMEPGASTLVVIFAKIFFATAGVLLCSGVLMLGLRRSRPSILAIFAALFPVVVLAGGIRSAFDTSLFFVLIGAVIVVAGIYRRIDGRHGAGLSGAAQNANDHRVD